MLRMYRALVVLSIIGCVAFPFGSALKCYVCTPSEGNSCKEVNEKMLEECSANKTTPDTSSTTSSASSSVEPTTEGSSTEGSSTEGSSSVKPTTGGSSTEGSSTEGSSTEGSSSVKPTTEGSSSVKPTTGGSSTEKTTTEKTTTEESTTEESTTEETTTEESTTEESTTEETTTEESTTEESTTKETTTEKTTTEKTTTAHKPASYLRNKAYYAQQRDRRSLMDRLSPMHPFAENTTVHCFTLTSEDGAEVTRGCSTDENMCSGKDKCKTCDSDKCNSATSNIVFTSMIMSLVIALIIAK